MFIEFLERDIMPKKSVKKPTKKVAKQPSVKQIDAPAGQPPTRPAPFRVVHFEINTDNPDRAVKFYQSAFGWTITKWEGPTEYWLVMTGDPKNPGIDGGLQSRMAPGVGVVNVIEVPDIDASIKKITASGGTLFGEKLTIPGVGHVAYFRDTEGNLFGLIQNLR